MSATALLPASKLDATDAKKLDFRLRLDDLLVSLARKYPLIEQKKWLDSRNFLLNLPNWQECATQSKEDILCDLENLGLKDENYD